MKLPDGWGGEVPDTEAAKEVSIAAEYFRQMCEKHGFSLSLAATDGKALLTIFQGKHRMACSSELSKLVMAELFGKPGGR